MCYPKTELGLHYNKVPQKLLKKKASYGDAFIRVQVLHLPLYLYPAANVLILRLLLRDNLE